MKAAFSDTGVAVAIISAGTTRFYLQGYADHKKSLAVSKATLFEIGSVTKPLVGLLTALAIIKQQMTPDTIVASLLQHPDYQQHQYSIARLLTHSSGLPRLPANLPLTDLSDPYANYSHADLITALKQLTPGEQQFEYSNFGFGLLAELLSCQQGHNFAALIEQQIFEPLGMSASTVAITNGHYPNLAQGHQIDGSRAANWHFQALAGAGAVLSTIEDMALLIKYYLDATGAEFAGLGDKAFLADAMRLSVTPPTSAANIGFGWMLHPQGIIWHNGQTGGFNAFVGFAPAEQVGIVILNNSTITVTPGAMALLQQLRGQARETGNEQGP